MLENFRSAGKQEYEKNVQKLSSPPQGGCDEYRLKMFERLVSLVKESNAKTKIFLVNPPCLDPSWTRSCAGKGVLADHEIIDLQSAQEYPDLFAYENRWDKYHVRGPALNQLEKLLGSKMSNKLIVRE
jgi:hypothetical protein